VIKEENLIYSLACKITHADPFCALIGGATNAILLCPIPCRTKYKMGRQPHTGSNDSFVRHQTPTHPNPNYLFWVVKHHCLCCLQDDDDHGHCRACAVPLEIGGNKEHAKIYTSACIKQVHDFAASNGFYERRYVHESYCYSYVIMFRTRRS
jgi:hypothetical protein